jgi:DNA-binding LacI/PurR family transcriptional regulator
MYASLPVDEYSHATTWTSLLENGDVDGLVIVGVVFNDPVITSRIPRHIPVVVVDAVAASIECDTIITHNFQGAYDAVTYLIEQGHTRIGLIGSSASEPEHPGIRERRLGYMGSLSDHGISETYIEGSLLCGESAYAAARRLLDQSPRVTAIFACNDDIAQHVIQAVKDSGLRVPEDISVIGFDDTDVASNAQPPLTTMRVDKELMGALAVRQLYERAANLDRPPITTLIGTRLVLRSSVTRCTTRQGQPA